MFMFSPCFFSDSASQVPLGELAHYLTLSCCEASSDSTGSNAGGEHFMEMECGICTETRPYTSFISTTGEHFHVISG
jgi:hypothetical protein